MSSLVEKEECYLIREKDVEIIISMIHSLLCADELIKGDSLTDGCLYFHFSAACTYIQAYIPNQVHRPKCHIDFQEVTNRQFVFQVGM